jgi:hypothetical protein
MRHFIDLLVVLGMVCGVLLTGCKSDSSVDPKSPSSVICPLTTGTWWVLVDSALASDGSLRSVDSSMIKITANYSIQYNGNSYPVAAWTACDAVTGAPQSNGQSDLMGNGPDGFYEYGIVNHNSATGLDTFHILSRSMMLKWPVATGSSWLSDSYNRSGSPDGTQWSVDSMRNTISCVATGVTKVTPAGTFSCTVYEQQWSTDSITTRLYFAPNIGPVSVETVYGGERTVMTLKRYHIAS